MTVESIRVLGLAFAAADLLSEVDGRGAVTSGVGDAVIRHLVGLCQELNVTTVAESVDMQAVADSLRDAGVDYARGWLFGPPSREPQGICAPMARREGAFEQWG